MNPRIAKVSKGYRSRSMRHTGIKVSAGNLPYPADIRDTAKRGIGCGDNRHLRYFVESISVNVGGSGQNDKPSCTPQPSEQARVATGSTSRPTAHTEAPEGTVHTRKGSSLPMSVLSVGGPIVVRGRESCPHGEGGQFVGIPKHSNQVLTRRNLH